MKRNSIIVSLVLLGTLCFVVFGAFVLWYSTRVFESEITRLNRRDYGERIRNIETEYQAVDAVSMASDEVYEAQEELLDRLQDRYIRTDEEMGGEGPGNEEGRVAYPFIINGDRESILRIEESPLPREFVDSDVAGRMLEEGGGSFTFTYDGQEYWTAYDYYEPWDWVTGYVTENASRLAALRSFSASLVIAVVAGLLVVGAVFWAYVRRSLSPLARMSAAMESLIAGNLSDRLSPSGNNEITAIAERFNDFADRLSSIIESIQKAARENQEISDRLQSHSNRSLDAAQNISSRLSEMTESVGGLNALVEQSGAGMEQVMHQVNELGESIDEQFAAVTEASAAAEQMSASLDNVARITREKTESSTRLRSTVRDGGDKLAATREIIADVNSRIDDISNLVSIIQNVAAQTNLLSMNAAIEAAHAGEAGKGFAVVAGEIRKLAEESSENSKSISQIIGAVVERIRNISESSEETGSAFESIESEVGEVSDSFQEIASSTDELASGSTQIRTSMSQLKDVSSKVKEAPLSLSTLRKRLSLRYRR